jgi:hypothetical protein
VRLSRRLIPYLLLGTLTLGAGLGAGLALAQGPVTRDPGAAASPVVTVQEGPCTVSTGRGEARVSCASSSGSAYSSSLSLQFDHLPGPAEACITKALRAVATAKPTSGTGLRDVVRAVLSTCRGPGRPSG